MGVGEINRENYTLMFSGSEDKHELGATFLVSNKLKEAIMDF